MGVFYRKHVMLDILSCGTLYLLPESGILLQLEVMRS